jgi:PAS domain S-box-containing protein
MPRRSSNLGTPLQRYGIAVLSCAAALGLSFPTRAPESCFFVAVIVSNLWGGKGPGFLSVGLTALSLDYFFLPPAYHLSFDLSSLAGIMAFLLATLVVTILLEAKRRVEESHRRISSQYQTVSETAPDAIFSIDGNNAVAFANPAATKIFGWSNSEMIGKPVQSLMPALDVENAPHGSELIGRRKDGSEFAAEVSLGEVSGDQPSFTTFVRDVSERKRGEAALQRSEASLAQAQKFAAVGEMAASIAHEVNQPLSAVVANGYACMRWLSADPPSIEKATEAAERIVRDGKDAGDVIRHVRSLFKRGATEKTPVDVNEVISESLRLLRGEIARRRVAVSTNLSEEMSPVMGDRVQLQQLVLNLLINGMEAMDPLTEQPKEILIQSKIDGETVLVEISDSGFGIENPDKIFDAFFTTKENGMGMGLAICQSIIETHQGRLWATQKASCGSVFSFTLPLASSAVA